MSADNIKHDNDPWERHVAAYHATQAREAAGQVAEKYTDRFGTFESVKFAESYVRRVWELIARDHDGAPLDLGAPGLGFREALAFHAMTGVTA